jgi:iron complex transport system substrate-binding protein
MRFGATRFVLVTAAVVGWACAASAGAGSGATRQVEDATGRRVQVPERPKRVLSLCTSVTDTVLRLGAAERLAGIDEYSRVVPGASNLVVLGKGSAISREQVLARGIDLAFVWWFQDDAARTLEELEVPTVMVRCGRVEEVPGTIRFVGQCLGLKEAADKLAASVAGQLEDLRRSAGTNGPRVYVELYSPFKTSGRDSFLNDVVALAGGRNVAGDASGAVLFSGERLLQSDPEVVVLIEGFGTPETFRRRGGLENLSAVKSGRVHVIDRYCLVAGAGVSADVSRLRSLFGLNNEARK